MVQKFLSECEDFLRTSLPDVQVCVTGGPYRTWDVNVIQEDDRGYIVDLYTAMRGNGARVRAALEYAVRTIMSHHLG
ncbi:MAG: hypothetical protein HY689_13075 [Chloroflexi bacterium]|nr:hypothetical protein [Chloroflexota bacterium]